MALLLIYHFNPRLPKKTISTETGILFFLFGVCLIFVSIIASQSKKIYICYYSYNVKLCIIIKKNRCIREMFMYRISYKLSLLGKDFD